MKSFLVALLAITALVVAPSALADTFDFSFTQGPITAQGTLTYDSSAPITTAEFLATSGTITVFNNGVEAATGSLVPNPNSPSTDSVRVAGGTDLIYDDLVFLNADPIIDNEGLLFQFDGFSKDFDLNIWSNGPDSYTLFEGNYLIGGANDPSGDFVTPEPNSLFLLGTGLLGLALIAFRKAKVSGGLILRA